MLKLKEATKVLPPGWDQVLEAVTSIMWHEPEIKKLRKISICLIKSLNENFHDVWTFRKKFSWLAYDIEQIVGNQTPVSDSKRLFVSQDRN